jgi:hypothetical protein
MVAALVLVLAFGNQAFTEWVPRHTRSGTVWHWFLATLAWPGWAIGGGRDVLAHDLRAVLLLGFVAVVLLLAARQATGAGAFVVGWGALILASALAAFVAAFVTADASLLGAFAAASAGSAYGLFTGWIVGVAVTSGA